VSALRYVDEYRDGAACRSYSEAISRLVTKPWTIMEICGGQTHSIVKYSLDSLLPESVTLVHGPGCPVCVTPVEMVDAAIAISRLPGVAFCSFGDMLRVPGSSGDLLGARASGADVRIVYSPFDAVEIAAAEAGRQVVFFAVGFETTAPVTAAALLRAKAAGLGNFSMLVSHLLVPPAVEAVLSMPSGRIQGLLAPGHVCSVTGFEDYEALSSKHGVPMVVTGFEPLDLLQGIHMCLSQLEGGRCAVENQYTRCVSREGSRPARDLMREAYRVVDREWRGLGPIPGSGLDLAPALSGFDALTRFGVRLCRTEADSTCMAGKVLTGELKPDRCPEFGSGCTPAHPLGAPMVSSEGACAAYWKYGKNRKEKDA
jgi:hydrogenase expression/formation protein HypD